MKRTETDSLGSVEIDATNYWGPQTERARHLFRIGTERFPTGLIRAVGLQKQAAQSGADADKVGLLQRSARIRRGAVSG